MEHIKKSIYSLPDIRHALRPLWSAWALVLLGAICGFSLLFFNISDTSATALASGVFIGVLALITVICFYLFGDSRRPYHKQLHALLEPTYTYYASSSQQLLTSALEQHDEQALQAVKKNTVPELILVRYSDEKESIFFSQLLRLEGEKQIPLTDIIVNVIK